MEHKHTPGPWESMPVDAGIHRFGIICANDPLGTSANDIAAVWLRGGQQKTEANARLIAAAPDLLEALQAVVRVADRSTVEFDAARAAIAKATRIDAAMEKQT